MGKRWQNSTRRSRLPENWRDIRITVLNRDQYACQWRMTAGGICGQYTTDVDHITPGDDHRLSNLQALCSWHHARKSAQEGHEAQAAKKKARLDAEAAAHPGMQPISASDLKW